MDSIKIKEEREEALNKVDAIEAIATKAKRELNEEEKTEVRTLLDTAKKLKKDEELALEMEEQKATRAKNIAKNPKNEEREKKELKEKYSLTRAVQSLGRNGKGLTGIEAEMNAEAEKENREAGVDGGNLNIPTFMMEERATVDQTNSAIQPTEVGNYIDSLRENAVYEKVGVTQYHGLTADFKIPRGSKQSLAWATAENSAAADGGANLTSTTLNPVRLTGYVDISNRVLLQNGPQAMAYVMRDLGRETANKTDAAIWSTAAVSNAPASIPSLTGVGTFTETASYSANVSIFADFVLAEQELADAQGLKGNLAYVASTKLMGDLKKSANVASVNPAMTAFSMGEANINGYKTCFTTACTSATTAADFIFGDMSDIHLGHFGTGLSMTVDPYSALLNDETRIVVHKNLDFTVGQVAAFVKGSSLFA